MAMNPQEIRSFKPESKPYKKADAKGLYLLVKPNGSKLWNLKYRFGGKEKKMPLGAYPEVSLMQARKEQRQRRRGRTTKRAMERSRWRGFLCAAPLRLAARATSPSGGVSRWDCSAALGPFSARPGILPSRTPCAPSHPQMLHCSTPYPLVYR